MTDHLARALAVRALSRAVDEAPKVGAALAVLRADALTGVHDDHPAVAGATAIRAEIMALTPEDMPPSSDLVAILLETAAQRQGGVSWAHVWRSIGVNPGRGRDFMSRNAGAVDWPIWYTLRNAALGK